MKRTVSLWFFCLLGMTAAASNEWRVVTVNTNTGDINPGWVSLAPSNLVIRGSLVFSNTVWDDLNFPVFGLTRNGTTEDPSETFSSGPGGNMHGVLFGPAAKHALYGHGQTKHAHKYGAPLFPHFHYTPTTTATGGVVFAVESSFAGIGTNFPVTVTNVATNIISIAARWGHIVAPCGQIPTTNGPGPSGIFRFKIIREATDPGDTYPDDVDLLDFDCHFEIDKPGTDNEFN